MGMGGRGCNRDAKNTAPQFAFQKNYEHQSIIHALALLKFKAAHSDYYGDVITPKGDYKSLRNSWMGMFRSVGKSVVVSFRDRVNFWKYQWLTTGWGGGASPKDAIRIQKSFVILLLSTIRFFIRNHWHSEGKGFQTKNTASNQRQRCDDKMMTMTMGEIFRKQVEGPIRTSWERKERFACYLEKHSLPHNIHLMKFRPLQL